MISHILPPVLIIALSFAQAGTDIFDRLVNVGVAGIMLLWFMFVTGPRLKSIEETQHKDHITTQEQIGRLAKAITALVISTGIKTFIEQGQVMEAEIDKATADREEAEKIRTASSTKK